MRGILTCKETLKKLRESKKSAYRIPIGSDKLKYEDRVKRFSLTTLNDWRLRGDLIEMYKMTSSRERERERVLT